LLFDRSGYGGSQKKVVLFYKPKAGVDIYGSRALGQIMSDNAFHERVSIVKPDVAGSGASAGQKSDA